MHEAKQMTTGQPVGAASHTTGGFPVLCESAASQYRVGLILFCIRSRPRCSWGRFWVLEPDEWETFRSGS